MANSAGSPAGSLFGQSSALSGGVITNKGGNDTVNKGDVNNPTDTGVTDQTVDQNNNILSLADQLTKGAILIDDSGDDKQKKEQQTQQQEQYTDANGNKITQEQSIINELLKDYKGENLVSQETITKIETGLTQGDISGITDALEETGLNAYNRALNSFLKLIPEIINSAEQSVLSKVGQQNQVNDVWSEFRSEYPGYAKDNALVREHIIKGIEAGKSREEVFAAVDLVFSATKEKPEIDETSYERFSPEENAKPFDVRSLIGG